ncbi:hypothetical protein GGH91_006666, partial [Coemansia sp. RSA 2671]
MASQAVTFEPAMTRGRDYLDALFARLQRVLPSIENVSSGCTQGRRYAVNSSAWFEYLAAEYGSSCVDPKSVALSSSNSDLHSHKWLFEWVLRGCAKEQLRLILRGLRMADEDEATPLDLPLASGQVGTSSIRFRDELQRVCLNAGFSCHWALSHPKGGIDAANEQGQATTSQHEHWVVSWSDDSSARPLLTVEKEFSQEQRHCKVWCVTVPTQQQLIIVRRVQEEQDGVILSASRPVVIGNTGPVGKGPGVG